jgi:hypothetical protein
MTIATLKAGIWSIGGKWFDGKPFDLNLIGVRSDNPKAGAFDDMMYAAFYDLNREWQLRAWHITTDPGPYYLANPMNPAGTAVLAEGQYPGVWMEGLHKGKTPALVQVGDFYVHRDKDKDGWAEVNSPKVLARNTGINSHGADEHKLITAVGLHSAACQTHQSPSGRDEMMFCAAQQRKWTGWKRYTYTLLNQHRFKGGE